jgi:hypothetical protein
LSLIWARPLVFESRPIEYFYNFNAQILTRSLNNYSTTTTITTTAAAAAANTTTTTTTNAATTTASNSWPLILSFYISRLIVVMNFVTTSKVNPYEAPRLR